MFSNTYRVYLIDNGEEERRTYLPQKMNVQNILFVDWGVYAVVLNPRVTKGWFEKNCQDSIKLSCLIIALYHPLLQRSP